MLGEGGNRRQGDYFETCSECKTGWACCNDTTPPVTAERRKIIEAYLKEKDIAVVDPFSTTEYTFPRLVADGYCVFHDTKTGKCVIHPVKPETCVAGPVTFDINVKSGRIEWFLKMDRICPLAAVIYRDRTLLGRHLENAEREILRLVAELSPEELKAVLRKDEPETFKIGEDILEKWLLRKLTG